MTTQQILKDEKAPSVVLLGVVLKNFGRECLEWDPAIMRKEIETEFSILLSELQSDKLQAAITVLTTDLFESDWKLFESTCQLFNCIPSDLEVVEPLSAEELIAGLCEASVIRHESLEFSPDVRAYAGQVFAEYGLVGTPTLFPQAIMPVRQVKPEDIKESEIEKNAALQDVFSAKLTYIREYANKAKSND